MSLKLFEPSESNLDFPEPPTRIQQKRVKNRQGFNLHKRVPLDGLRHPSEYIRARKNLIRKLYGKKILYITGPQEANAIVSRSKLLKYVEVNSAVIQNNLKSKGNLVIFSHPPESVKADVFVEQKKRLFSKKIPRNCQ